jgi:hypothetical protein
VQLANNNYDNFEAIVDLLDAAGSIAVFYLVDTSIAKVASAWAVINESSLIVVGNFGHQGPAVATFTTDFPAAVAVTTPIAVME